MQHVPTGLSDKQMRMLRVVSTLSILVLGIYVALKPGVVYAPTPKVILYFLVSFLPAILFGVEAVTKFELRLPTFAFITGGAFAACLGTLLVLTLLSKPEQQIAVFHVKDEQGHAVSLDWEDAIVALTSGGGLSVTKFVQGNTVILVFPEQVGEVELEVRKDLVSLPYVGSVTYAGERISTLYLGRHLKQLHPE